MTKKLFSNDCIARLTRPPVSSSAISAVGSGVGSGVGVGFGWNTDELADRMLGITGVVSADVGAGPLELVMLALMDRGIRIHVARWGIELSLLAIGLALGAALTLGATELKAVFGELIGTTVVKSSQLRAVSARGETVRTYIEAPTSTLLNLGLRSTTLDPGTAPTVRPSTGARKWKAPESNWKR